MVKNWPVIVSRPGPAKIAPGWNEYKGVGWHQTVKLDPCPYCTPFGGLPFPDQMTIEHVEPVSIGGENAWWNKVGAHRKCNSWRSSTPLLSFLVQQAECARWHAWSKGTRRRLREVKRC